MKNLFSRLGKASGKTEGFSTENREWADPEAGSLCFGRKMVPKKPGKPETGVVESALNPEKGPDSEKEIHRIHRNNSLWKRNRWMNHDRKRSAFFRK